MKLKNKINQERDKKLEIKRIMFKLDKKNLVEYNASKRNKKTKSTLKNIKSKNKIAKKN